MEIEIFAETVREGVPVEIVVYNAEGDLRIHVLKMGYLTPLLKNGRYEASFWAMETGEYKISVKDQNKTITQSIQVSPQSYLSFKEEFGVFLILLLSASFCLSLLMRKWRKKI